MSSYHSYSGVAYTNQSSIASVSADLITHRGVWRKIISIIVFTGFLITAWATIVLHAINFSNESILELSVSVSILIAGQYIITGIVDGIIYWRRWNASSQRQRTKMQEQNKEAWVLMRITLTVLGMAPIARYIESLVIVKRMISLEEQYMSETIAFVKEVQQPSNLPSGSLLSVPITNNQLSQQRKTPDIVSNPSKMKQLDAGIHHVRRVRRQFCRTEHDAAIIALTSGVVGAGPYAIAQGILFYRRETMRFFMTNDTKITLLICTIFSMLWISTSFTHFYPASYQQNRIEFERGIGQVHIGGLILLFIVHLIHITLRCFSIALFTGRFYPMILIILGGHFLIVLITIMISRQYTSRLDHLNQGIVNTRGDVCGNFFVDLLHSYISLYEFFNANVKYTRTRYLIYYFFYYLENSIMIGLWYDYYQYPESWYYLPCLLVVVLVQLLGFILLQVYFYIDPKSRHKTSLCGFCLTHKSTEIPLEQQSMPQQYRQQSSTGLRSGESMSNYNRNSYNINNNNNMSNNSMPRTDMNTPQSLINFNRLQSGTLNNYPSIDSINYTVKHVHNGSGGICDPVFGEQIAQTAVPLQSRNHHHMNKRKSNLYQKSAEMNQLNQRPLSELTNSYNSYSRSTTAKQLTNVKHRRYASETRQKQMESNVNNVNLKQRTSSSSERPISRISKSTNKDYKQSNDYLSQEIPSYVKTNNVQSSSDAALTNTNSRKSDKNVVRHQPRTSHNNSRTVRSRKREGQSIQKE
ncbi:unnamed protein product [Schistosoma turkestanicum]|nr:unnamed protein product [Schistosoma turkestanicum]